LICTVDEVSNAQPRMMAIPATVSFARGLSKFDFNSARAGDGKYKRRVKSQTQKHREKLRCLTSCMKTSLFRCELIAVVISLALEICTSDAIRGNAVLCIATERDPQQKLCSIARLCSAAARAALVNVIPRVTRIGCAARFVLRELIHFVGDVIVKE